MRHFDAPSSLVRWPTHQVLIYPGGRLVRPQSEQVMGNRRQDAWKKAAMCEAHARSTKDVELQTKFLKLRDSWIRIANGAQFVKRDRKWRAIKKWGKTLKSIDFSYLFNPSSQKRQRSPRMTKEPLAEDSARRILDLFVNHFHHRAGGTLSLSHLLCTFEHEGFRNLHFQAGMELAINNGWITPNRRAAPNSYTLTSAGFGETASAAWSHWRERAPRTG